MQTPFPIQESHTYPMQIFPITDENIHIYLNLAQCYEAEFSSLTRKKPDSSGKFALDTQLGNGISGYLLLIDDIPAGIAAIACKQEQSYEVCEFYVLPCFRNNAIGMRFAHTLWKTHPAEWEIKQIKGAESATSFWRKTIKRFEQTAYTEDQYNDPYWGNVIRQRFTTR